MVIGTAGGEEGMNSRKIKAGTHHPLEMPKIEWDMPQPSVGLKALTLILCITFVVSCVWFYKAVV
jgi:hypothetical protein